MERKVNCEVYAGDILNSTLSKLTRYEICCFGLKGIGVHTYKGAIKSRVDGFKITAKAHNVVFFENDNMRWEVIRIIPVAYESEYAVRLYNKETGEYETDYPVSNGSVFFK